MIPLELRKSLVDRCPNELSIVQQCQLLGINRSTLYYTASTANAEDLELMRELDKLYLEDPTRGTRRLSACLRHMGIAVGRHKVRSLMRIMRLKTIYCQPRTTVIDPAKYKYPYLLRNLDIVHSNQVWALDITYIPMKRGYMYLLAIIDVYSRYIVGWSLSNTMEAEWVVNTLKVAIQKHGKPKIINTDQGSQFTSEEYIGYVKGLKDVKISMDGKGRATDNAFIERFFRTLKHDKLYLEEHTNGLELHEACQDYINYYNQRREHSSLSYNAPIQLFTKVA